jgi:hypothetical protein
LIVSPSASTRSLSPTRPDPPAMSAPPRPSSRTQIRRASSRAQRLPEDYGAPRQGHPYHPRACALLQHDLGPSGRIPARQGPFRPHPAPPRTVCTPRPHACASARSSATAGSWITEADGPREELCIRGSGFLQHRSGSFDQPLDKSRAPIATTEPVLRTPTHKDLEVRRIDGCAAFALLSRTDAKARTANETLQSAISRTSRGSMS